MVAPPELTTRLGAKPELPAQEDRVSVGGARLRDTGKSPGPLGSQCAMLLKQEAGSLASCTDEE